MGLFGGGARRREQARLLSASRGRLNAQVWADGQELYVETARQIEIEHANTALTHKFGDPLPREDAATAAKLMPITGAQGVAPLEDGLRTAYLLGCAEAWEELDAEEARVLAREGCRLAAQNGREELDIASMRAGSAILGFCGNHPAHVGGTKSAGDLAAAFKPLYDLIATWGSYERLTVAGASFATDTVQAFGASFLEAGSDKTEAELCYARAWNLGLGIFIWRECGFLDNPTLEPSR